MNTTCLKASLLATAMAIALPATSVAKDDAGASGAQEVRIERQARPGTQEAGQKDVRIERRIMRRPVIGVLLTPDDGAGVRISGVTPDSPAAKAGLRSGDRLVSISGTRIAGKDGASRVENARNLLRDAEAGKVVRLGYERGGRSATADVTPRVDERVVVWQGNDAGVDGEAPRVVRRVVRNGDDADGAGGGTRIVRRVIRPGGEETDETVLPRGVAPSIHREVIRIAADGDCRGEACNTPHLLSALRWNGLNLASVDAGLGRYFGTDRGVLVLSAGGLGGLQAGDVIHSVDGKAVNTPREVMDALRGKPGNSRVAVSYLRDRKPGTSQVTVPKMPDALPPLPPPPPAPPAPPKPPKPAAAAPAASLAEGATDAYGLLALAPPAPPAAPRPATQYD